MRRISEISVFKRIIFLVFVLIAAGCSLEKETGFNRAMQNLTAHYNILFDANEILRQKQEGDAVSFVDSYNEILSVYQDTTAQGGVPDKDLEEVKAKANKILNIKEQSHYRGDAYLLLGKASYLEGDFFSAVEYFNYVVKTFADKPLLVQEALTWKARSLIYLKQLPKAKLALDTAIRNINPKKSITADVYATKLQYDIDVQDYADGEEMAKQAAHYAGDKLQRLRRTFIMAQLQELNSKNEDAFKNYTSIVNSNVSFEMAFNANLNRIRISNFQNGGGKETRIAQLKGLLKNDNNKDFIDQVYYQMGEIYYTNKDIDNAVKNYNLSVRHSRKNQNQKGLSYLRLADIYFKTKADYIKAKKYYDSTLMNLSTNYPGYQVIKKTGDNLQLLADRFGIIAREDTLQMLAQLDEVTRAKHIDAMVNRQILQQQADLANNAGSNLPANTGPQSGGLTGGSFYFYNSNAVGQGYSDFKRRWGNRKLEDNWRRSNRSGSDITGNTAQAADPDSSPDQAGKSKNANSAGAYRQQILKDLPLTPDLLNQSNTRIYNAYFDIANFYRDILGDKKEAIATYELLLKRFPNIPDKPALYYNLYRLYADNDNTKSDEYKNLLLKNYPDSPFAKVIVDPEYAKRLSDADAEINGLYNEVYDDYAKKDYQKAIDRIDQLQKERPNNKWASQLAYLRAISAGHLEKLAPFEADLNSIVGQYANDKLIVPLVKQHLVYVNAHRAEIAKRPFALTDKDPNEDPFIPPAVQQEIINPNPNNPTTAQQRPITKPVVKPPVVAHNQQPAGNPPSNNPQVDKTGTNGQPMATQSANPTTAQQVSAQTNVNPQDADLDAVKKDTTVQAPTTAPLKKPVASIFSLRDSTNYYFVVNVSTATVNLASSRFGIGQFNRANFDSTPISHQLVGIGDNSQLIYVGRFYSLSDAKKYARAIIPMMPDIMKVPKDKYSFFIITQENLDKIVNKNRLDSYMDFYQDNY